MDIEHGAEVIDKNGKRLGTVGRVIRDSYTTEITKFTVSTGTLGTDLFFSPQEVQEANAATVRLSIALDEGEALEVKYGAEVVDRDGKVLGTVDYPVRDTLTGEIRSFKVNTEHGGDALFFSTDDLLEVAPTRVKLKLGSGEAGQTA